MLQLNKKEWIPTVLLELPRVVSRNVALTAGFRNQHKNAFYTTNQTGPEFEEGYKKKEGASIPLSHAVTQHDLHWLAGQNANLV